MQTVFFLVPAVLFFATYKLYDFYAATAVLMALVTTFTIVEWVRTGRPNKLHLVSTVLLLVLGGITLVLRDPLFLMWKFSIFHWLIAAALLWSHWFREKTGLQAFFETLGKMSGGADKDDIDFSKLPRAKYRIGNVVSIGYFLAVGFVNLFVAFYMSEAAWVNFKLFGISLLNFFFLMGLMMWLFAGEFNKEDEK